ncbi:unnamed protein product [Spirodela intermedia]|uniref:Uncharacterized protein n=1 Tax=Spirodela intermedia TaxID=51605 RepID=A0A7I8L651_SPIIN|nr:unnamed protein product [Spirodela intermedia]
MVTKKCSFCRPTMYVEIKLWVAPLETRAITLSCLFAIGDVLHPKLDYLDFAPLSGLRYVVGCYSKVDKEKLTVGTRLVLEKTTLAIMRALPQEVLVIHQLDHVVYNMLHEDPGNFSYSEMGVYWKSTRLIREMVGQARDHQPCIIFMDDIDAIDGRRLRGAQVLIVRFKGHLISWGRYQTTIPLPNVQSRMEILKIHAAGIAKHGKIDYEAVVKFAESGNSPDIADMLYAGGLSCPYCRNSRYLNQGKVASGSSSPAA